VKRLLRGISLVLVAVAACAPQDVVVATLSSDASTDDSALQDEPPAGDGTCMTNADCPDTSFCAKTTCRDATGSCQRRLVECGGLDMRACGCDGVTYWNDCLRQQYGVASSIPGECQVHAAMCDATGPSSCPVANASCEHLITPGVTCGDTTMGACWVVPLDPSTCTGPDGGPPTLWMPCEGAPICVDTCSAVQSGQQYHPTGPDDCPGG
jgi:hypothetical protein